MTTPATPLSRAAQAVWDAWNDAYEAQGPLEDMGYPLAAALITAADQPYEVPAQYRGEDYWMYRRGVEAERGRNLAIAAELRQEGRAWPTHSAHVLPIPAPKGCQTGTYPV